MITRSVPETENKLMILYTLARLGPCTADQLLQFMAEYGLMDYFTLQLALCEMVDQGQLQRSAHPFGEMLSVTPAGVFTVEEFDRRIPASLREAIDGGADVWRERFYLEQQAPAEAKPAANGRLLTMQLLQGEQPVLMLCIPVETGDSAAVFLQRKWREVAYDAWQLVQHLLGGDLPEGDAPPMPEDADVQDKGSDGLLLTLKGSDGGLLTVQTEDERTACWYAHRWQTIGGELLKAVLELLHLTEIPGE